MPGVGLFLGAIHVGHKIACRFFDQFVPEPPVCCRILVDEHVGKFLLERSELFVKLGMEKLKVLRPSLLEAWFFLLAIQRVQELFVFVLVVLVVPFLT